MKVHAINFHGDRLLGVEAEGPVMIPVKPICDALGLDWEGQRQRIERHPVLSKGACIIQVPFGPGGKQGMACLPLTRLNFWLATVNSDRIENKAIRDRVILYQEECADVLFAHFMKGQIFDAKGTVTLLQNDLFAEQPGGDKVQIDLSITRAAVERTEATTHRIEQQIARTSAEIQKAVVDNATVTRRPALSIDQQLHDFVVRKHYNGYCPACDRRARIIEDDGRHTKLYHHDHWTGNKSKRGRYEMIPVCKDCNIGFETKGTRASPRVKIKVELFFQYVYDESNNLL